MSEYGKFRGEDDQFAAALGLEDAVEKPHRAPEGSLEQVREKFGPLIVDGGEVAGYTGNYRGQGERILFLTKAKGLRGPSEGQASIDDEPGTAFIDFAVHPDVAERMLEGLQAAIAQYKKEKENKSSS